MSRLIKTRQVEIVGDKNTCCFNWRYVSNRNKSVLKKTIQRASYDNASPLKFYIVEAERSAGYLNQSYPSDTDTYIEISRQEVTEDWLFDQFKDEYY